MKKAMKSSFMLILTALVFAACFTTVSFADTSAKESQPYEVGQILYEQNFDTVSNLGLLTEYVVQSGADCSTIEIKDGKLEINNTATSGYDNYTEITFFDIPADLEYYSIQFSLTYLEGTLDSSYGGIYWNWQNSSNAISTVLRLKGTYEHSNCVDFTFGGWSHSYQYGSNLVSAAGIDFGLNTQVTLRIDVYYGGEYVELFINDIFFNGAIPKAGLAFEGGKIAFMAKVSTHVAYDNVVIKAMEDLSAQTSAITESQTSAQPTESLTNEQEASAEPTNTSTVEQINTSVPTESATEAPDGDNGCRSSVLNGTFIAVCALTSTVLIKKKKK